MTVDDAQEAMSVPTFGDDDQTTQGRFQLGKVNQMRALGRKAISYQKRQMFTNICCIR
jgi:hypothetical protein